MSCVRVFISSFILSFFPFVVFAQIDFCFPKDYGIILNYVHFDSNGKLNKECSWSKYITNTFIHQEGDKKTHSVIYTWDGMERDMVFLEKSQWEQFNMNFVFFQNDTMFINYMTPKDIALAASVKFKFSKGGEYEFSGDDYQAIPKYITVGARIPDSNSKYIVKKKECTISDLMHRYNVKVECKEDVKVPAGTFLCYKISENFEYAQYIDDKININKKEKHIKWITPGKGVIKYEVYNEIGKLIGYSMLDKIDKTEEYTPVMYNINYDDIFNNDDDH